MHYVIGDGGVAASRKRKGPRGDSSLLHTHIHTPTRVYRLAPVHTHIHERLRASAMYFVSVLVRRNRAPNNGYRRGIALYILYSEESLLASTRAVGREYIDR